MPHLNRDALTLKPFAWHAQPIVFLLAVDRNLVQVAGRYYYLITFFGLLLVSLANYDTVEGFLFQGKFAIGVLFQVDFFLKLDIHLGDDPGSFLTHFGIRGLLRFERAGDNLGNLFHRQRRIQFIDRINRFGDLLGIGLTGRG